MLNRRIQLELNANVRTPADFVSDPLLAADFSVLGYEWQRRMLVALHLRSLPLLPQRHLIALERAHIFD